MGYQLWTSPTTGHRRRGTRFVDVRDVIGANITARAIYEPLQSAPASSAASLIRQSMKDREFDVAGVKESQTGPLLGYVKQEALSAGIVRDHVLPLPTDQLVSEAAPLSELLKALSLNERVFVVIGRDVSGIVTRTDLNKPPVRVYLFALISLLELHLNFWIDLKYPNSAWQDHVEEARLTNARALLAQRVQRNPASTLLSCLQFADKRDLLLRHDSALAILGLGSKKQAKTFFGRAEALRNDLAHSESVLADGLGWEKILQLVEAIERGVHGSDTEVERRAREGAQVDLSLWQE